jgi:uncharacterized protein YbaP (TraB family)
MKRQNYIWKNILVSGIAIFLSGFPSFTQSLLWRITHSDLSEPSYLYGTIHISDSRVFELRDTVYKYLDNCDAFAAELDLSMETMITIAGMMMLPEGQTLNDRFNPEDYELIRKAVKSCSGYDLSMFNKMKPPALIAICFANTAPHNLEATVDELLYKHAKATGLSTFGIETVEEQIALFDKIPDTYVLEYFRHIDQQDDEMENLIRCYRNADLDSLLILIQDEESGSLLNDELIRHRNYRMAERIIPLIHEQPSFVAIGCGHLPGSEGVIALLRKEGYKVEPVADIAVNAKR